MKTWSLMYSLIWVAFIQILIVLFPFPPVSTYVHALIGVVMLAMAYLIYVQIARTDCPKRIKRITKTTLGLGGFQAVLGTALYLGSGLGGSFISVVDFLHVVTAIAILSQASSSATAYDMWEEKEYIVTPAVAPTQAA